MLDRAGQGRAGQGRAYRGVYAGLVFCGFDVAGVLFLALVVLREVLRLVFFAQGAGHGGLDVGFKSQSSDES
jgi:hypothetical protein